MKKKVLQIAILIFVTSCGFKVINQSDLLNFYISDIESYGSKRINYKIKNKLLIINQDDDKKEIKLILNTKKTKTIKEKNIKNEITKYQITFNINVSIKDENNSILKKFNVSHSNFYNVATQYSKTLNNEKKIIGLMSNKLTDKIIDKLIIKLNDL